MRCRASIAPEWRRTKTVARAIRSRPTKVLETMLTDIASLDTWTQQKEALNEALEILYQDQGDAKGDARLPQVHHGHDAGDRRPDRGRDQEQTSLTKTTSAAASWLASRQTASPTRSSGGPASPPRPVRSKRSCDRIKMLVTMGE